MSVVVSKADGVTVFTVKSNPRSKWPLICQILGTLCYSPVCSVSYKLKQRIGSALTALATIQIMIGIINLSTGFLRPISYTYQLFNAPFWIGPVFIVVGVACILAEKYPSACLIVITVFMNLFSIGLAITAIVLYSNDLAEGPYVYGCEKPERSESSPSRKAEIDVEYRRKLDDYTVCLKSMQTLQMVLGGVDVMLIVFAVLQLCVVISWCTLSLKALCKKTEDGKDVEKEDPELYKPIMQE